jgi:mono/diheme cytochrome c family protein
VAQEVDHRVRRFLLGAILGAVAAVAVVCFLLERGYVDLGADRTPSRIETKLAMNAVDAWADRAATVRQNPLPSTEANITDGATLYLNHCAGCHGVPSNPESQFQRSFYPPAPGFFREMPDMQDPETFHIVKRGIRWTGMPAWDRTLTDDQIWQLVLFFNNMHKLPPDAEKLFEPSAQPTSPRK